LPTKIGTGAVIYIRIGIVPAGTIKSTLYTNNDFKFVFISKLMAHYRSVKAWYWQYVVSFNYPASQTILMGSSPKDRILFKWVSLQCLRLPLTTVIPQKQQSGQKAYVEKGNEVKFYHTIVILRVLENMRMTIYGDPANFSTLDDLIKTLLAEA
jgi:hypothetical protein